MLLTSVVFVHFLFSEICCVFFRSRVCSVMAELDLDMLCLLFEANV